MPNDAPSHPSPFRPPPPETPDPATNGTLVVDAAFRVMRFTPGAADLLGLTTRDLGQSVHRPLGRVLHVDLSIDLGAAFERGEARRREWWAADDRVWLIWIRPALGARGARAIVTVIDVLAMRSAGRLIDDRATATIGDRASLTRPDMPPPNAQYGRWLRLLHDVGEIASDIERWSDAVRAALHETCRAEGWQLGQLHLPRRETSNELRVAVAGAEDEAFDRFRTATEALMYARGQDVPGRVLATSAAVWLDDGHDLVSALTLRAAAAHVVGVRTVAAFPIRHGSDVVGVLELMSRHPHRPSTELMTVMSEVAAQIGRIVERGRLVEQAADAIRDERRDLIHTLHDTVGQELTGIGLLGASLARRLELVDAAATEVAEQVVAASQRGLEQIRQLSRGALAAVVTPDGLAPALQQLASATEAVYKIRCRLDADSAVRIPDARAATALYHIAQEAVTNALKHARAGEVVIRLAGDADDLVLAVSDDGIGMPGAPDVPDGVGLRIIRHRAAAIGATISIAPRPQGGTVLTCALRRAPTAARKHDDADADQRGEAP